jgi:hypothetical protein
VTPFAASWCTTIPAAQLPLYRAAVSWYRDPDVVIVDGELHDRQLQRDLTRFWRLLERLEQ